MFMRILIASLIAVAAISTPAVTAAQERVLTIFGEDKCPANTICVVAPEADRFRIPKELRPASANPQNQSWAVRSRATLDTGSASPTACQSASASNGSGCWAEAMRKARADAKAKKEAEEALP
jgi:hypothetical protein